MTLRLSQKKDILLIKYGELALKKRNRYQFEEQLISNIRHKLERFLEVRVQKTFGRIFVHLHGTDAEPVIKALQQIFGIVAISPVVRTALDVQAIERAALMLMKQHDQSQRTFKVETKRPNKKFPLNSQEISRKIGGVVLRGTKNLKVDVRRPDILLSIEIRQHHAYLFSESYPGLGGLPVGSSGKAMLLLSGGIDSPVAGFLTMKRGVEIEAVHFHSYPYTSERSLKKVEDLTRQLTAYGGKLNLHIVPFTEIQTAIREKCQDSFSITVMRRFMFRIAEALAAKRGALALATGESLGQVASQTLESMRAIGDVVSLPVLRPLISMDKQEIISLSKQIGTYETSILPYEDCCTVFMPQSPQTRPSLERTRQNERDLDVEALVEEAVRRTERKVFTEAEPEEEFASYFE